MNRIKETITALANWNEATAIRVNRKENMPLSEECFRLAVKCINWTATLAAATVVFVNADIAKLGAVIVGGIFFYAIYCMMKD